jgi:uncharacterized metal-binding protein
MNTPSPQPSSADRRPLPLVYSCSGCSNAAQLANTLAVRMDRAGLAEMSCIAGVGGDVRSLVSKAKSERLIIVLDGCMLHCARHCLRRHGIEPTLHIDLTEHGIKKRYHEDVSLIETHRVWKELVSSELPKLAESATA